MSERHADITTSDKPTFEGPKNSVAAFFAGNVQPRFSQLDYTAATYEEEPPCRD